MRARRPGDIEKLFPTATVAETVGVDYLYRACIKRTEVGAVLAKLAAELEYDNFKDSIDYADRELKQACSRVWGTMSALQPIAPYSSNRPGLFDDVDLNHPRRRRARFAKRGRR